VTKYAKNGLLISSLCLNLFLPCFLSFHSSEIFAEGPDTSSTSISIEEMARPAEDMSSRKEKHTDDMETALVEEFATEAIWFGFGEEVTIATRHETSVGKAPSIVTVITGEEIKHLGYRTLIEVLRTVPGFEIRKEPGTGVVEPIVRGVEGANKVKVMLNGHTVNTTTTGSAFGRFDDFPVENIKKIEIIRGPGSAMYGENAFLAVINIITLDAGDIDGVRVSTGFGSFDTYEENVVFGKALGKVGISGMAHYRQTSGFDGIVEKDAQSGLDQIFGSSASLAPGKVHDGRQEFALNMKVTYEDLWFQGWYSNKNREPFIGGGLALNDESDIENNYVFGEIGYKKTFEERFTLKPRAYYDQFDSNSTFEAFPENTFFPPFIYPDGMVYVVKGIERIIGAEIPLDVKLFDGNILTLGMEYRLISASDNHFLANFDPDTGTPDPNNEVLDYTDTSPFLPDITRRVLSLYLQDTWDITDTVNLTLGVRHDRYNDFGEATSPRVGLTWLFMKDASLKLLYGEAFRAPTFYEMFQIELGNRDLDPERIKTYELGLSYKFSKYVTSSINYFYNDIEDLIAVDRNAPSPRHYENLTNAHVQGFEVETRVDISKGNYIFMNYTFKNPEDEDGNDLPLVAQHTGNFGVNVHLWKYINTNLSAFFSGRRSRIDTDEREDLPAYALLNFSLIGKEFFKTMEIQGTVFNILDKDYRDPAPPSVPDDLPRPERTFFVGLSYQF